MPNIDLSILNQRATPAFFADTLANRPAPSFVGRIFISTDTLDLYRDTGTAWLLLSPSSTGTITGSGAAGQVTIFSGASSITGTNNLFWDTSNLRLGINTNTPGAALDLHSTASTLMQLNQTTATNDTRIAFQNSGVAKWRIGSFYNLGSNDYAVNDATLNINRFTIKSSSGQTFVGDETTSSGLFVVNNSSADAHLVVLGATAPSFRVRNAGVGASLQFGLGLATTTNNFIQGATGGEFCIFNDSLTAQPILFGIKDAGLGNTQEAARISASRNLLVGTSVDAGQRLQVSGAGTFTSSLTTTQLITRSASGSAALFLKDSSANNKWEIGHITDNLYFYNYTNSSNAFIINGSTNAAMFSSNVGINGSPGTSFPLEAYINSSTAYTTSSRGNVFRVFNSNTSSNIFAGIELGGSGPANDGLAGLNGVLTSTGSAALTFYTRNANTFAEKMRISADGNVGFGTSSPNVYPNYTTLTIDGVNGSEIDFEANGVLVADMFSSSSQFVIETVTSIPLILKTGSSEAARISSSKNLLIGTTTDNGSKLQVNGTANINGTIIGDNFLSVSGAVSNPFAVWTTMFTIPANQICMYQLIAVSAGNGLTYTASALIVVNSAGIELRNYVPGGALILQISGYDVQVQNGSGSTLSINYKYIKIG